MKAYHSSKFIYSWKFYIHVSSHIFFEHLHDFKTHTYVQIKIKFSKIAFLSKYCKFDTWSYFQFSFSKLRHMNFAFFKIWSHFFSIFELDYIVFFFYEREFYLVILLLDIRNSNSLNITIWNMKFISSWISLIIVKHSMSLEFSWTLFEFNWT